MLADRIDALIVDKGDDADAIHAALAKASVEAVIQPEATAEHRSRMIARNTAGIILSDARLTNAKIGVVPQCATIRPPNPTSAP